MGKKTDKSSEFKQKSFKPAKVIKKKNVNFTSNVKTTEQSESQKIQKPKTEYRELTAEELSEVQKPENIKNVYSKRQQKKDKHEKFKVENKIKSEANAQQKGLNYLSSWKHNRTEWRFEKLKQIWLQRHMFDSVVIPETYWKILVEYFSGAKGRIRDAILKDCIQIVEGADKSDDNSTENEEKIDRARTLIQHLQE